MDSLISDLPNIRYEDLMGSFEQWNENFDLYSLDSDEQCNMKLEDLKEIAERELTTEYLAERELTTEYLAQIEEDTLQPLPVLENDLLGSIEDKTDNLDDLLNCEGEPGDTHVVILNIPDVDAPSASSVDKPNKPKETSVTDITEHANKNGDAKKRIPPGNINNESVKQSNTPRKRIENYYKMPYVCDICSKSFNQKTSLSYHKQLHSEKKNYTCKMCDKTLLLDMSQPKTLIHTCVFTCNICDKSFATNKLLTKHLQTHSRVFVCKICKKSFITEDEFRRHKPTCLPKITCTVCSKVFSQNKFAAHMARHSSKKCNICGKLFYSNYGYQQHLRSHERKY